MKLNKLLILMLVLMLSLNFVSAWYNTTFNNTLSTENLTFYGSNNVTRWLEIPGNYTITEAYLNLTGFRDDWRTTNYTDDPVCEGSCVDAVRNAFDKSLTTILRPNADGSDLVTNYSIPATAELDGTTKARILLYYYCATNQAHQFNIFWKSASYDSGNWQNSLIIDQDCSTNFKDNGIAIVDVDADVTGNMTVRVDMNYVDSGNRMAIRELRVVFYNSTNDTWGDYLGIYNTNDGTSRFRIYVNDTTGFSRDTDINITNNRTNFAGGVHNFCKGLECIVPITFDNFHEYDFGTIQYSSILFSNDGFYENSQTYNSTTTQLNYESFLINITYDSDIWDSITSRFYYNGTEYTGTQTGSGDNLVFKKSLTIPVTIGEATNNFYWTMILTNSSGTFYYNSSDHNQTVNPIIVGLCNTTLNVSFINFTVKDAEDTTTLVNTDFKITMLIADTKNFTYSDSTETNSSFAFCFEPSYNNYSVDATIEYDAADYAKNYYYLNDAQLNNVTQNITLYLLNDSKATLTEYFVYNRAQTPQEGVYIMVQRYDVGTDTYYTVAMLKTSDNGKDLAYLNWYDTFYKEILTRNNTVIKTTVSHKIAETPQNIQILDDIDFEYLQFEDITYLLYFNNLTNNFVLTYALPDGTITDACLRVIKRNPSNDTTICDTCETSSSATIYCNIDGYGNGTYIATFYAKGSLSYIDTLATYIGAVNTIYDQIGNEDGSIYAFIMAGIVLTISFVSPVFGVAGALIGMLLAMILGFQPFHYLEFIGIVLVGGLIIWLLNR